MNETLTTADKVRKLFAEGCFESEAARRLGISKQRVHAVAKLHGFVAPKRDVKPRVRKGYRYHPQSQAMVEDYDSGKPVSEICNTYGIHVATLYRVLNRYKITKRNKQ